MDQEKTGQAGAGHPGWKPLMEKRGNLYHVWDSLLPAVNIGDLTFIPLTSELELFRESEAMVHMVSDWGPRCAEGLARIFRVERLGEREATIEIGAAGREWRLRQVRGPFNRNAAGDAARGAETVARLYNQEWLENPRHRSWTAEGRGTGPGA